MPSGSAPAWPSAGRAGEFFLADANGGLTPETALRMLRMLPGLDIVLEAPCRTWRETMSLRSRCPVPIVLDELVQHEEDLILMISQDAADGIGLKVHLDRLGEPVGIWENH